MKKRIFKKRLKLGFMILFFSFLFFIIFGIVDHIKSEKKINDIILKNKEVSEKKVRYNKCLIEEEIIANVEKETDELEAYLKNYNISVVYNDINTKNQFVYNEKKIYYGASLIKLVDALYIYDKNIDLDETMVYDAKYKRNYSSCMDKRIIGSNVTIKDLVYCALSVSDNTAHIMLMNYIGINNLQEYGKSLGAKNILIGGDLFGNQSAEETNIYLKRLYEIIDTDYGMFLKKTMLNTEYGYLNIDPNNINVAHKYGDFNIYFHDIGIVFEEFPYTISVLTTERKNNFEEIINKTAKLVNKLHNKYVEDRKTICHDKIYSINN